MIKTLRDRPGTSLSVVIPAFNEETRLPATLDTVLRYMADAGLIFGEVIVVDDGSRDGTASLVKAYQDRYSCLRLISNPGNRGKGYAVRHGMTSARGEWILFSDADLSSPIEEVVKLFDAAEQSGADVVIGSRALDRSLIRVHQSAFREYSGRVFNLSMRFLTGLRFADTQCGFKLFRRRAAMEIFQRQLLDGFSFDVEALLIARRRKFRTAEVAVRWSNVEGTKVSMLQGLQSFADIARIRWFDLCGHYTTPLASQTTVAGSGLQEMAGRK